MITLAIFEKMSSDGVGGLTRNEDFFWEEMPLQKDGKPASGVWLVTRGGSITNTAKGNNLRTTIDFYVAFANKAKTEYIHSAIRDWLTENMGICELEGTIKNTNYTYDFENIRIFPTATPQVAGATENGLIVKLASASVVYDIKNKEEI